MDTQTMYALAKTFGATDPFVRIVASGEPGADDEWHARLIASRNADGGTIYGVGPMRVGADPGAFIEANAASPGAAFDELGRVLERAARAEHARISDAAAKWLSEVKP